MTNPQQPGQPGQEPARFAASAVDLEQLKNQARATAPGVQTPGDPTAGAGEAGTQAASASSGGQAGSAPAYFEITDQNFESDVVRRSTEVPVVVLLGTSRAAESDEMKANLEQLVTDSQRLGAVVFGYVDADKNPAIAQAFRVEAVPTVVALGQGQPLTQFQGAQPADVLAQWLDALIQQIGPKLAGAKATIVDPAQDSAGQSDNDVSVDPRHDAAEQALSAGDYAQAREHYDAILADDPADKQASLARKTVEVIERFDPANRGGDAIAEADAAADDVDKQLDAADAEVLAGAPDKAFERLIETMKITVGDDKERLRTRVISLFELFDPADPRVKQARTNLASALF